MFDELAAELGFVGRGRATQKAVDEIIEKEAGMSDIGNRAGLGEDLPGNEKRLWLGHAELVGAIEDALLIVAAAEVDPGTRIGQIAFEQTLEMVLAQIPALPPLTDRVVDE
jgi:hypothetical protein